MADEEEVEQVQVVSKQAASARPVRRLTVREHDADKTRTAEIVEHAQVVLDTLAAQREEQLKAEGGAEAASDSGLSAFTAGPSHKEMATLLKRKLDSTYGGTWHAIVGTNFGGNVTNDAGSLVNFSIDGVSFLVLRSGPPDRPQMEDTAQNENARAAVA